jgi:hypothetical protein
VRGRIWGGREIEDGGPMDALVDNTQAHDALADVADVTTSGDDAVAPPPPDFLWFKLDETSGDVAHDSSPNHKDVVVTNIAWSNGGVFHNACGVVQVDGSYRVAPVTITAWLTPALRADEQANAYALTPYPPNAMSGDVPSLGGFGIGLDVWTNGGGSAALAVETGIDAPIAFHSLVGAYGAGSEHFVALVIEASTAAVYIDGAQSTTVSADTPPPTSPVPLHLGCHNDDTGYGTKRFYEGNMRDVRVYRRAVPSSEVAALFAAGPV